MKPHHWHVCLLIFSLVMCLLFKQFETMQNQITELIPKVGNYNTVNNVVNKPKININIFLNEQCKDAITMNEFIEKINAAPARLTSLKIKKEKKCRNFHKKISF